MERSGLGAHLSQGPRTYHTHQQLVEPLQLKLRLGPHVWAQGRLQEGHTPAGQHLPRRARRAGVVVDLEVHWGQVRVTLHTGPRPLACPGHPAPSLCLRWDPAPSQWVSGDLHSFV